MGKKMTASMLSESRLQEIVASTFRECGIEVYTEKLTPEGSYIDLYLPGHDAAIELKSRGDQKKGVGQALEYNRHYEESCLLVPESQKNDGVATTCEEAGVGYGVLRLEDWKLCIFSTYPFDFVVNAFVNAHGGGEDIPIRHGMLPVTSSGEV
jgi:hypothetical protein